MAIKIQGKSKFQGKSIFAASSPTPTYTVTSNAVNSADEGTVITFTLNTTNVGNGTVLPYTITGITQQDLSSGSLTGNFTVNNNTATASITLANDALTEGSETMTVSLSSGVASDSVVVNDTSRAPTYAIGRSLSAVNEGSSVIFTLSTTNVANGTVVPYTISGISSTDVTSGTLSGSFTVSNNLATATITLSADQLTEGAETATLTLNNSAASNFVVVNDTSVWTPAAISGLQVWLDGSDTSTLFNAVSGGSNVTTRGATVARWQDKSGNNRNVTQATVNARPIYNSGGQGNIANLGIYFDGSNDSISTVFNNTSNSTHAFIALQPNLLQSNTSGISRILNVSFNGSNNIINLGSGTTYTGSSLGAIIGRTTDKSNLNDSMFNQNSDYDKRLWVVSLSRSSAGAGQFNVDGEFGYTENETGVSGSASATQSIVIGGTTTGYFKGWICEVLLYSAPLTTTQRNLVTSYLSNKWSDMNNNNSERD